MKKASIPVYIRFGEIPSNGKSKIYLGDEIVGEELGLSVYEAIEVDYEYYPIIPENVNENGLSDYFEFLIRRHTDYQKVYLVTGDRIRINGKDGEPLLENVKVIKDISSTYYDINKNNA